MILNTSSFTKSVCMLVLSGAVMIINSGFRVPDGPPLEHARFPPGFVPTLVSVDVPDAPNDPSEDMVDRFFFSSESVDQVLVFLGELTGKKILAKEQLPKVQISFDSNESVSKADAIVAIESLLQMNGIAIAEMGDTFIRVLPAESIRFKSPSIIRGSALGMHPSERVYAKVFKIKYMTLEEGSTIIGNLLTQGVGYLEPLKTSNDLIITDTLVNLQRIERLLGDLDVYSEKEIIIRKLSHMKASDLAQKLTASVDSSMGAFISGKVSIDHDDRTNQIVIASDPSNRMFLECLIDTYDAASTPFTINEIVYLKHAESDKVVSIVGSLISEQKKANEDGVDLPESKDPSVLLAPSDSDQNALQFSQYVTVESDERSNAVLIYGTRTDVASVKEIISNLDVLLPQVRIDVVITEVTLSNENNRGIDRFGISYDENDEINFNVNENSDLPISLDGSISDLLLSSLTIKEFTLGTVFSTAKKDADVRVISAPTLVTTHNREAVINAGESRPVITSSNTDSTGSSTRSQISYKDIGVMLKVKPLIGSNGMVQMEIQQIVESVVDEVTIDGNSQPIIGKREATSFVSVSSGEVVVLGGLQEKTSRNSKGKTGFWGSIPLLGRLLFTSDREKKTTRELIIFIKPTVFMTAASAEANGKLHLSRVEGQAREDVKEFFLIDNSESSVSVDSELESVGVLTDESISTEVIEE